MYDFFSPITSAYTHNGDKALLESLDFKTGPWTKHDWNELGVYVHDNRAVIHAEVCPLPANFFRFTIRYRTRECVIETGSGGFGDYWGHILLVADSFDNLKLNRRIRTLIENEMLDVTVKEL